MPRAEDVFTRDPDEKVLMKMERENASWTTYGGVLFTKEHPYALVEAREVEYLEENGFREANSKELREFYGK